MYCTFNKSHLNSFILLVFPHVANFRYVANFTFLTLLSHFLTQQNLGRLLFWGTQGVKRDLRAAAEYYRMGADRNDPQSLHDYGIVLLKVGITGTVLSVY